MSSHWEETGITSLENEERVQKETEPLTQTEFLGSLSKNMENLGL